MYLAIKQRVLSSADAVEPAAVLPLNNLMPAAGIFWSTTLHLLLALRCGESLLSHRTATYRTRETFLPYSKADNVDEEGLLLPSSEMLEEAGRGDRQREDMQTLMVDGAPVLLDKMGPVVVAEDGSLASIANWHEMTEGEQALTLRRIGKRNQQRLKALREKEGGNTT